MLFRHAKSLGEFSAPPAFLLLILITLLAPLSPGGDRHPWHYSFVLLDGYVGWVETVYSDRSAPLQPPIGKEYQIEISEDGIFRTGSMRVLEAYPKDIFLYRSSNSDDPVNLTPLPPEYVLEGTDHGGFEISEKDGRHWFIFIGPPELRSKTRFADWPKEVAARQRQYGTADLGLPTPLPKPGRMTTLP